MIEFTGGCKCKNINFCAQTNKNIGDISPRACDCEFCVSYNAKYVSDPHGSLIIEIANPLKTIMIRQGSGIATFLVCQECSVLISALHDNGDQLYGAVNASTANKNTRFGKAQSVSPKHLSENNKIERWSKIWFPKVVIKQSTQT